MSQPPYGVPVDADIQPIMNALLATYGSLAAPNFSKFHVAMAAASHRKPIADLRERGADVLETTDENDDVSTQLFVTQSGDEVGLSLSGVGPFAAVVHYGRDGQSSWVTRPKDGPTPLAKLVAKTVQQAGFTLLDRDLVTRLVPMNRYDGSTEVTLYQALFSDSDWIP